MAGTPRLVIDQQYAVLGIEMTPAQMKITVPRPEMQITRENPEFSTEYQTPEFKLNWKKTDVNFSPDYSVNRARVYEGRAHIADENAVNMSKNGKNRKGINSSVSNVNHIAQMTRHKTIKTARAEINLKSMQQRNPEVEWSPGAIKINWTKGSLNVNWVGEYMPEVVIDPPFSIEIFLREKPYITVMVEDGAAPEGAGAIVDRRL